MMTRMSSSFLAHLAGGIAGKDGLKEVFAFVEFERVGEADSVEGAIFAAGCVLEGDLDIGGFDVIGVNIGVHWGNYGRGIRDKKEEKKEVTKVR